ncbi:1-phosphatidylinositol 3-phosphate 5-kinase [Rhynchospora pubera]|uniref:1-phosphatidylinositol-3-phosphate 5-kinase n=1 Tax=Rhynchospora pubera TaxID=906938 RepID=A0AAV8CN15_9POAL|nr:1-phosphatidylinositol 3-phosphate 5-kinase [Rhynchospora pubera]
MGNQDLPFIEFFTNLQSWFSGRRDPDNISKVFWMPDHSCHMCYDCDSSFNVINRRHHCRMCGKIFCGKCTTNSIPYQSIRSFNGSASSCDDGGNYKENTNRVRVCNFCFNQWENEMTKHTEMRGASTCTSTLVSTDTTSNYDEFDDSSEFYCELPDQHFANGMHGSTKSSPRMPLQDISSNNGEYVRSETGMTANEEKDTYSSAQYEYLVTRSDEEDGGMYAVQVAETLYAEQLQNYTGYYSQLESGVYYPCSFLNTSPAHKDDKSAEDICSTVDDRMDDESDANNSYDYHATSSLYAIKSTTNIYDFQSNISVWSPPDPDEGEEEEEEEQEQEPEGEGAEINELPARLTESESWKSLLPSSSFKSYGSSDPIGDQMEALKHAADDHFRLLIEQLLQIENVPIEHGDGQRSWVDIVQSLAEEVAEFVRPDHPGTSNTMDPAGFVKIKCIASGDPDDSMVVNGIACKKNMAHRRMITRLENPQILILGGALEYQRVKNALSSIDTLIQQETEHLKMAVAKIEAQNPDLLLVEESVSRVAQEMLLQKNIPLVLNIKRSLLDRIALCTNAIIAPSVDLLAPEQMGTCNIFHVDKFVEMHDCSDQATTMPAKNLMFFEGCPRPDACTVVLKGASLKVLKKVKHVMQVGIFVAYHASLEKSFLEDDRACIPESITKSPITVPLPDIPLSTNTSISTVPGFHSPNDYSFYGPSLSPLNDAAFSSSNIDWIEEEFEGEGNPCKSEVAIKENLLLDDNRSILISLSTRCVWKRRICGSFQVYRIKYYGNFDRPLEQYLRENMFDQDRLCYFCDLPPEAHAHCYIHQRGTMTISMRRIPDFILPGEREKKIWTWQRCLKCPLENGLPPSNKRVILSSDTMSLSFGRFLELSFSDHNAATRVAECGHSVHKDCLRFYGTGNLVACFQYKEIAINSAFLPPLKLEFGYRHFDWVEKEATELAYRGEWLFEEISSVLCRILDKNIQIEEIHEILKQEKVEFQTALEVLKRKEQQVDILEINKLRRQLFFHSLLWDQRLVFIAKSIKGPFSEKNISGAEQYGFTNESESTREDSKSTLFTSISLSEDSFSKESSLLSRRTMSDGHFPNLNCIHDVLDARWIGNNDPGSTPDRLPFLKEPLETNELVASPRAKDPSTWIMMPFPKFYESLNKKLGIFHWFNPLHAYMPVYIILPEWLGGPGGPRFVLPMGVNDMAIPIFEDEPTSVISYALASRDYHDNLSNNNHHEPSSKFDIPLADISSSGNIAAESSRSTHLLINFDDEGPEGKVCYSVICYYAKCFDSLRKKSSISEKDFIRSLCRCKNWMAQGGKSKVFFAKSLDDRFVIKQVTRTELESFLQFGPAYFKYVSDSIGSNSPTCLAKIYGIYQVHSRNVKLGKEQKMEVLVMENLLFGRHITRLYDLKGSTRSRYNPDTSGKNKVLLDENLIESMPTSPIFVAKKSKRILERAVWNDTFFLSSIDVMDYSLLVGVDEHKHELIIGIIDFMRQYTWDKHLETWVKASGILGGPKNVSPTVISPKEYKLRFRKAMSSYFLVIPDDWVPFTTEQDGDDANGEENHLSVSSEF